MTNQRGYRPIPHPVAKWSNRDVGLQAVDKQQVVCPSVVLFVDRVYGPVRPLLSSRENPSFLRVLVERLSPDFFEAKKRKQKTKKQTSKRSKTGIQNPQFSQQRIPVQPRSSKRWFPPSSSRVKLLVLFVAKLL